jgi:release factor glutamine methyltransferase
MNIQGVQIRTACEYIKKELAGIYSEREIYSLTYIILEDILNMRRHEIMLDTSVKLDEEHAEKLTNIVQQLKDGRPVQYILGYTFFCGLKLHVSPRVLIPRPETEELVYWIVEREYETPSVIVDIGTGSGCIALALQNHYPSSTVYATDSSPGALAVARENAISHKLQVHFFRNDILTEEFCPENIAADILVSNPPYVKESEKQMLDYRILAHEPHSALFVDNNDPLLFYKSILRQSDRMLKQGGRIYFEIHEHTGKEMTALLHKSGYQDIELKKDINDKDRMITAVKNHQNHERKN